MNENELAYINRLRKDVYAKISDYVNDTTVDKIVAEIYNSFVVVLEHGGASIK